VASSESRWIRAALIAASVLIVAIAAVGCGGADDSGGGGDAQAQFERSLGPDGVGELQSGNLDLTMKVDAGSAGQSGSFNLELTGPFQSGANGSADLHLTGDSSFPDAEGSFDIRFIAVDRNFYVSYRGQTYELGAAQTKRLGHLRGGPTPSPGTGWRELCRMQLETGGSDPSVCDQLRPGSWISDFSDEGTETIGGVEASHLQGQIDVHNLVTDLVRVFQSTASKQGILPGAFDPDRIAAQVDRYVDKAEVSSYPGTPDGIPRRIGLDLSVDAGVVGNVDLTVEASFEHVNEPQTIQAPSGPVQPIQALVDKLPPPLRPVIDCVLKARTQAELSACYAGAGALGGAGGDASSSFQ
jgi:hypothetical protein